MICLIFTFDLSASLSAGPITWSHRRFRPCVPRYAVAFKTAAAFDRAAVHYNGRPDTSRLQGAALSASKEIRSATYAPTRRNSDHWHVWRTADKLEREGLSLGGGGVDDDATRDLTLAVVSILRRWGSSWAGRSEWQGLLNKSSLTHEVEESIVALRSLLTWMNSTNMMNGGSDKPAVLVDVCCGKGVLSMLASYIFGGDPRVDRIVMLDRASIKWDHIDGAKGEGRPPVEAWGGCNLHDVDDVADRLRALDAPCLLIGIHLCKMLSPACVGVANTLGPDRCPFLCLAPCCLPRAVLSGRTASPDGGNKRAAGGLTIAVRQYESKRQREERRRSKQRRDSAMVRRPALDCYLCASPSHPVHRCSLLPADQGERIDVFRRAAAAAPCWKCGEIGHFKADCPSDQLTGKPSLIKPPKESVDVSDVLASDDPFDEYCSRLAATIQRDDVRLEDAGLVTANTRHQAGNWNGARKSIFITARQR